MPLPPALRDGIKAYRAATPWYAQWPLFAVAIPLWIIVLAIALGIAVADTIAMLCTTGQMPSWLLWLC